MADFDDGGRAVAVNDVVLTEILLRLPAKSVTRLKSVCKRWLSLISGDQFRRLHTLRRYKPQPSLLLRHNPSQQFFYLNPIGGKPMMVPYSFTVPNPKIVSSCNGLLLLRCENSPHNYYYYAYNPTTKQSRKINLDYDSDYPCIKGLNLAFDPSKSPHYKIVCVRASRKGLLFDLRSYQIEVYDSVSHTWKLCFEPFTDPDHIFFSCGVHWNNSIYWKTSNAFLYFDIDKNVIRSFTWPEQYWGGARNISQLQESNGHLYHIVPDPEGVAFWELELQGDDHSQWLLKHHDMIRGYLVPTYRIGLFDTGLLRFNSGSDEGETSTLVVYDFPAAKIKAYRFRDRSFEELVDLINPPFYHEQFVHFDSRYVHQFGETLALV